MDTKFVLTNLSLDPLINRILCIRATSTFGFECSMSVEKHGAGGTATGPAQPGGQHDHTWPEPRYFAKAKPPKRGSAAPAVPTTAGLPRMKLVERQRELMLVTESVPVEGLMSQTAGSSELESLRDTAGSAQTILDSQAAYSSSVERERAEAVSTQQTTPASIYLNGVAICGREARPGSQTQSSSTTTMQVLSLGDTLVFGDIGPVLVVAEPGSVGAVPTSPTKKPVETPYSDAYYQGMMSGKPGQEYPEPGSAGGGGVVGARVPDRPPRGRSAVGERAEKVGSLVSALNPELYRALVSVSRTCHPLTREANFLLERFAEFSVGGTSASMICRDLEVPRVFVEGGGVSPPEQGSWGERQRGETAGGAGTTVTTLFSIVGVGGAVVGGGSSLLARGAGGRDHDPSIGTTQLNNVAPLFLTERQMLSSYLPTLRSMVRAAAVSSGAALFEKNLENTPWRHPHARW